MATKFVIRSSQTIQDFNFQYPSTNEEFGLQFTNEEQKSTKSGEMSTETKVFDLAQCMCTV